MGLFTLLHAASPGDIAGLALDRAGAPCYYDAPGIGPPGAPESC